MRDLLCVLCFAILLPLCCPFAARAAGVEVVGYEIAVAAADSDTILNVVAEVRLRLEAPTERLGFLFTSRASACAAEAVLAPHGLPLETRRGAGDSLIVALPPALQRLDSLRVRFHYSLPRGPRADLTYLSRGHRWYPQVLDQIAPYRLTVDLPGRWTSFSGGDLVQDSQSRSRRRMVWESAMPAFKIELALCPAAPRRDDTLLAGGATLHFVSSRTDSAAAGRILREAARCFAYFSDLLGEYPYRRLTIFETTDWPGTNIGSGIVVPGTQSVDAFLAGNEDELRLALASQWVGAGVFPKFMSPGFWFLQLSLPHYLRLMYVKEVLGESEFRTQLERSLAAYRRFVGTDQDVPIMEISMLDSPAKGAAIYGKGPAIADLLATRLGDGPWRETLQLLYRRYRGRTLTCADFCALLDERDRPRKPGSHLKSMLSTTGLPEWGD